VPKTPTLVLTFDMIEIAGAAKFAAYTSPFVLANSEEAT
jgi:hypothetical protein